MPLVFAGAPLVNVLFSMWLHPPKTSPNPLLYLGFVLAAAGAGMVLYFKPQAEHVSLRCVVCCEPIIFRFHISFHWVIDRR